MLHSRETGQERLTLQYREDFYENESESHLL